MFSLRVATAGFLFLAVFSFSTPAMAQDAVDPLSPEDSLTTSGEVDEGRSWERADPEERNRRRRERTISNYEPSGRVSFDRIPAYIDKFRRGSVYDERLYRLIASAEVVPGTTGTIILNGEVTTAAYSSGLEETLTTLGFTVQENRIELLPARALGAEKYAVVTAPVVSVRAMARDRSEQVNSVAMGGALRLLRSGRPQDATTAFVPDAADRSSDDDETTTAATPGAAPVEWYLAQTLEGYMGFVRSDQIERTSTLKLPDHLLIEKTTVTLEGEQVALPVGVYFHESADGKLSLKPGGPAIAEPLKTRTISGAAWEKDDVLAVTESLMGTRYQWGGVASLGIDCSGFTQFIWKSRGVYLPRDAKQQASVGQIVAWGEDVGAAAQPGDLLFFTNDVGRISHVGASLGNGEMIHSGGGRGVHVVKLTDPRGRSGRTYLEGIIFARRVQGQ